MDLFKFSALLMTLGGIFTTQAMEGEPFSAEARWAFEELVKHCPGIPRDLDKHSAVVLALGETGMYIDRQHDTCRQAYKDFLSLATPLHRCAGERFRAWGEPQLKTVSGGFRLLAYQTGQREHPFVSDPIAVQKDVYRRCSLRNLDE